MLDLLDGDEIQQLAVGEVQRLVVGQSQGQAVPDVPLRAGQSRISTGP
ncbi:hypothetical protein AAAT94_07635 [Intestinimonas aquisgranensis]|nr:hypothetical protein [Intestinimonas aquisgranensis]